MENVVRIPGFPSVDYKLIAKYLLYDIGDDWFQDPIRYHDYILLKNEVAYITNNAKGNNGKYIPSKSEMHLVPKSNFTVRYSLETDYYERWMYFYLVIPLIIKFDKLLPRQVYNHRLNLYDSEYLFFNHIQQWAKFGGIIRSQLYNKEKILVVADVQNYYENILIDILYSDLKKCVKENAVDLNEMKELNESIDCLINCLKSWSLDTIRGIPQNRDCSSFLANIYMLDIDSKMINAGFEYYRYMDDIRIICDDVFQARRALLLLVNILREKNLSLNSKKTKIIESNTDEYQELSKPNFQLQSIDLLLRTKRKANIAIGYSILKELLLSLIKDNNYDSREFRFCITRISKLARCKDYILPNDYFNNIINGIIDSLIICPTSSDSAFEFLSSVYLEEKYIDKIVKYLANNEHSIYEWQNYLLWKLLIIHSTKHTFLIDLALQIVDNNERNSADKAGAILYIAKHGDISHLIHIRDKFSSINSVTLQRHSFFALKRLDWKNDVKQIKGNVDNRLIGNFRIIKEHIDEIVFRPPSVKISEILAAVHQYE